MAVIHEFLRARWKLTFLLLMSACGINEASAEEWYEFGVCVVDSSCAECIDTSRFKVSFIVNPTEKTVRLIGQSMLNSNRRDELLENCVFEDQGRRWSCQDSRAQYASTEGAVVVALFPTSEIMIGSEVYEACLRPIGS